LCPQRWAGISKNGMPALFFPWYLVGLGSTLGQVLILGMHHPQLFYPTLSSFWSPTLLAQVEEHDPWRELGGGRIGRANLSMNEGSLFCSYEIHWTRMLQIVFLVSLESSWWGGAHGLGFMMFGLVVQKFLNIEWFLHWKWNEIKS
jgi:hypothetical protein